jgi:hypothetical protein
MVIAGIINRLTTVNEIFASLPMDVLNSPYLHKSKLTNVKQSIYNWYFIFKASELSLFSLIKKSGKVEYQVGGNPYQTMFKAFLFILLLAATIMSTELVDWTEPDSTNQLTTRKVVNSVVLHGTQPTTNFFGFVVQPELNKDVSEIFMAAQRALEGWTRDIRIKCSANVKLSDGRDVPVYTSINGKSTVEYFKERGTHSKDVQKQACVSIDAMPFKFNKETGSIEFMHVNMQLTEIMNILQSTADDMRTVIDSNSSPDPKMKDAYNKIIIIVEGLEKINELLYYTFSSPVLFDKDSHNKYRLESLEESLGSIVSEVKLMASLLSLQSPVERMVAESQLDKANEQLVTAEILADASQAVIDAKNVKSHQNVMETRTNVKNFFQENTASIRESGNQLSQIPVDLAKSLSDMGVNVLLAPLESISEGATNFVMNNKFIMTIILAGVLLFGVISIKVRKGVISVVYRIANVIKTIVLLPITVPFRIATKIRNLLYYREEVHILQIENGSNSNGTTSQVVMPSQDVMPVVSNPTQVVIPVVKTEQELDIERLEKALNNARKQAISRKGNPRLLNNIKSLEAQLAELKGAKGTRKRIAKTNTKKKLKHRIKKPTRKPSKKPPSRKPRK